MPKLNRTFERIVCVDNVRLTPDGYEKLQRYSDEKVIAYADYPTSTKEIVNRIKDADAVLVSWHTPITADAIRLAGRLKYIGMCCSLYDASSANVDIEAAAARNIEVRGIRDYGDNGVVEFIFAQLVSLYLGLGNNRWGDEPTELNGKVLGIVGFGTTGQMVARAGRCFGMKVLYYSRTRKPAPEDYDVSFITLEELLTRADVVSTHLPRRTYLLGLQQFQRMKSRSILVNTSLGPTFDLDAFCRWIKQRRNYAIFDADGVLGHEALLSTCPNTIISDKAAGWTSEARSRLTGKVLANIQDFLLE